MTGCPTGATETTPWIWSFPIPESSTASMHVSKMMSQWVRSGIRAVGTSPIPTIAMSLTPLASLHDAGTHRLKTEPIRSRVKIKWVFAGRQWGHCGVRESEEEL